MKGGGEKEVSGHLLRVLARAIAFRLNCTRQTAPAHFFLFGLFISYFPIFRLRLRKIRLADN